MFSTSFSLAFVFYCLTFVTSQENPVITRTGNHISVSMKTSEVDRSYNFDRVCDNYTTVPICVQGLIEITCPIIQDEFARKYDDTNTLFKDFMFIYEQDKNGVKKLKELKYGWGIRQTAAGVALRVVATYDAPSEPCYFCWFHVNSNNRELKQRSKAVKVEFYECVRLEKMKRIYHARPIGTNVTLTCWDAQLEENTTIEWHFLGPTDDKFRRLSSSDTSNISNLYQIDGILKEDAGLYQCDIWFRESRIRISRQFDLSLLMPPLRPIKLEISNVRDTAVTLNFEGNSSESKYLSTDDENQPWFQIRYYSFEKWNINQSIKVITNGTSAELTSLAPFTLYVVELRKVNIFGESEPIYNIFLTKNSTSVGQPFDFKLIAISNQAVTLKCYNYENVSQGIKWWKPVSNQFELDDSQNTNAYAITKVGSNDAGLYKCKMPLGGILQMHNFSDIDHDFVIQLSIVMPPFNLQDFRCENHKLGSVTLRWIDPNNSRHDENVDYSVDSYKLKYKKINSAQSWNEKVLSSNDVEAIVENLESDSYYVFRLSSVNKAGESKIIVKVCDVS